jgi:hypothetical protein
MCVEKLQKILVAMLLGIVLLLAGSGSLKLAFMLQVILMIVLILSGLTGFCFITKVLNSAFPMCNEEKN